jgi:hypothetical protein
MFFHSLRITDAEWRTGIILLQCVGLDCGSGFPGFFVLSVSERARPPLVDEIYGRAGF